MSKEISKRFKTIVGNRHITYETIGKRMGKSRQAIGYILNSREDKDWIESEIDFWCKVLNIDSRKIYQIKDETKEFKE